ncbi:MAG: hypothetical protein MJ152_02840, partial [Clostridia bacterium]|nr:hypothetical protein [Clostridia bacterium]
MEKAKVDYAYSVICDIDTDKYEVFIPAVIFKNDDSNLENIAQSYKDLCSDEKSAYMFKKCNLTLKYLIDECDMVLNNGGMKFHIPERHYTDLTKEECVALCENLENEYVYLNRDNNIIV